MTKESRTPEAQEQCKEIHDKYREDLLKRQLSNSENYDKTILSLSSTGLALSLTAIRLIVPLENASYLWCIKAAWILFLLTIIFTLITYCVGNVAIAKELKNAEDYYIQGVAYADLEPNIYKTVNPWLNRITGLFFTLAISLVVGFVICNVERNEMTDKKITTHTIFVTDSADIPRMQAAPTRTLSADIPTMQMAPGTPVSSGQSSAGNSNSSSSSSEKK